MAYAMLANDILENVAAKYMVTPNPKWDALAPACAVHGVSQRAFKALNVDRSSVRYRIIRPADQELREAMKDVASELGNLTPNQFASQLALATEAT